MPPLLDQSSLRYPMVPLEPLANAGGFFDPGRIVVERDRDRWIRVKAPLLFRGHLRAHETCCLQSLLTKPERPPERLAEDDRLYWVAALQPIEESLLEPFPEEPFR